MNQKGKANREGAKGAEGTRHAVGSANAARRRHPLRALCAFAVGKKGPARPASKDGQACPANDAGHRLGAMNGALAGRGANRSGLHSRAKFPHPPGAHARNAATQGEHEISP